VTVKVELSIGGEPYYVVAITKGDDAINQFFEFHITVRHEDREKIKAVYLNLPATLLITDSVTGTELSYECEVVARQSTFFTAAKKSDDSGQQLHIELRPFGWSTLNHKVVRSFDVGDEVEDTVNYSLPEIPTLDTVNRLLNLTGFEEESDWVETIAETPLESYRIDWWQNQLAFQIQETNASLFSRVVWKLGASFVYNASQQNHLWITIPDMCPVPASRIILNETQLSNLEINDAVENRYSRWYLDQFNQINHLTGANDSVAMDNANRSANNHQLKLSAKIPLSCDQAYEYQPDRKELVNLVFMPISVSHKFDHRQGYYCECTGQRSVTEQYFNFEILDETPEPFLTPIMATVYSDTDARVGDRDLKMRYRVRFDFKRTVDGIEQSPKSWLYRMRPSTSMNGSGDFAPLPIGTKVMIQMLNGDREQPIIIGTFQSMHGSRKV